MMLGGSGKTTKSSRVDSASPPKFDQSVPESVALAFRLWVDMRTRPPLTFDCKSLGRDGIRIVLNDRSSQWGIYEGDVVSGETKKLAPLEEALDFAHIVFKRFFVFMDESSPFRWIPYLKPMKHPDHHHFLILIDGNEFA